MKALSLFSILGMLAIQPGLLAQTQVSGTITTNTTWSSGNSYVLTGNLIIRNNAVLTIQQNVTVDLADHTITAGSTTGATLNVESATFMSNSSVDHKILFQDGANGTINRCTFNNVFVDVDADAGQAIELTNNVFSNVQYPLTADINRVPVFTGNSGSPEVIGIAGTVTANATLPKLQWDFMLSGDLIIRGGAILTLAEEVTVDLGSYNIRVGNSTPGQLIAVRVNFRATGSSDRYILFADEGKGGLDECSFNNVFVNIDEDAGVPIYITSNNFDQVLYPVKMNPARPPVLSGNTSTSGWIALKGSLKAGGALPVYQWDYILSESVSVRDGARLTLSQGVKICLNNRNLYLGLSSTNTGSIEADGASFYDLPGKTGKLWFRPNSSGTITNSNFEQCRLYLEGGTPVITHTRFFHCPTAVYLTGQSNPVFHDNDFYHNDIAIDHRGIVTINAENNYWGDPTGPRHDLNPAGKGEIINGLIDFQPFGTHPDTGTITAELEPDRVLFGDVITGVKRDSSFLIRNTGTMDLLISEIESSSSGISIEAPDQIWVLPDSLVRVAFSYTPLQAGSRKDTIFLRTNASSHPNLDFIVEAVGRIESILLNFYHIDVDSFPVVKCYFSLTDQANLPVRELRKENVGVSEQNINIPDFQLMGRSANGAIRVALVTDRSGSMAGKKLRDAKSAADDFVQQLSPMDQAALLSFSNSAILNLDFTSDKGALISAINSLRSDGSTALFDAIYMAISLVKDKAGIRAILALTDGKDNRSTHSPSEIINYANQNGVNIYTIGLGAESDPTMSMIALQTGGQFFYSPTSDELAMIYRMISGQLQNLYVVRYTAGETLPFPRKVELRVHLLNQADTAVRYYSMGSATIEFTGSAQPFRREEFSTESKDYFYYYVKSAGSSLPEGLSFNYYMESNGHSIPCGGEYLGNGIMQFWADFRGITQTGNYPVVIPDSVDQSGGYLKFINKPGPFTAVLKKRDITQSIDIFAGGSAGVKALAGALGAGPSIAAASVTASGTAGMGINFKRNGVGDEWVTRRLEAGEAVKAESPDINTVIEAVTAGVSAEVTVKGTVSQTMLFPGDEAGQVLMKKAKAAYLLETMSLGGMVVSPYFAVVLQAVQAALVAINPDVSQTYADLFESWSLGASVEGKVGAEFKIDPAEGSGLPEFTFAEASLSLGMSGTFTHMVQAGSLGFAIALATSFDLALINLEVGNVKLGGLFKYKQGAEVSIESEYSVANGLQGFSMSYLSYNSLALNLLQGYYGNLYTVEVPRPVIDKAVTAAGNIICDVGRILHGGSIPGIRVGASYFADAMDAFFGFNEDTLGTVENHILIKAGDEFSKGLNAEIKVGLDAALGVGLGLEFGVSFSYLDKLSSLKNEYVIAQGKILPTAEYPGVMERDNLFSITTELTDLFNGVISLVADGLKNLVLVGEILIDAGIDFVTDLPDYGGKLLGYAEEGGGVIIRAVDPRNWWDMSQPLADSRLVRAYATPRVVHSTAYPGTKAGFDTSSTLYLVSNAYNVSMLNQSRQPVSEFAPLRLKAAVSKQMMDELGFGPDEKPLAKFYYYNTLDMSWTAVTQDLEIHADTVGTDITKSGTYAIGIEIFPSHDKTAPSIMDHFPVEGGTMQPDGTLWAKLFEDPTGTGIDFGHTSFLIDAIVRDALWDPINMLMSVRPDAPLSPGLHNYTIHVSDYQGNINSVTISFTVATSGIDVKSMAGEKELLVYPNPVNENLIIEFGTINATNCDIAVYGATGNRVAGLYSGRSDQGVNRFLWNLMTDEGKPAAPGLYFVRIRLNDRAMVRKVIVR